MAETRDQGLVELNKQFEEMRVNSLRQDEDRVRHFEEQRLHSQNMEKQILEMKEILISMAARHRVQASSSKDPAQNSPSTPVSQFHSIRCERIAVKKLPDQVAHQVFDETSKSENTIENDGAESMEQVESNRGESSEDGDEGLIEDVLKIDVALEQDLAAHQVLDKMPELLADKIDLEIAHVSSIEELHDLEAFGNDVREQVVWALGNIAGDSPQCRDLARQSGELMPHLTQINEHAESLWLDKNEVTDLINLPSVLAPEEIVTNYIGVLCFDPGGNFAGVLLERHTVDYDLSCNCCLNPIEWVNWVAYMLRAHSTEDVKCELLKCFDMKGCLISIFLDYKIFSDKHSSHYVTTFLSSKWVGNSVTSKEVWKSLAKRYLMIVDNKEFASGKYWKCDLGTTLWCWETHDYLFHFANSLVNLEPSSSKEKNGDATQGLEGSDVESVSDTNDMENSYADVGSLFGIAPKTCFSIMHLKGEGHYSVALYCRRNHQIPENTSYLEVAPALAADCAAILKPSELASLTCLELGQVCKDVGLPAGVLNILTGLGPEVGAPLASHPDVDKIAFTGSNATGSKIMSSVSQVVKPVTMELGGKSPIIVFEDVDLDKAAEWTAFGCFRTNGLIVHENIATAVVHGHQEGRILIFIFDPGGTVKLNTQSGWRLSPTEFFMALLLRFLYAYIVQFMILGDKDRLKGGVLLQDYGV